MVTKTKLPKKLFLHRKVYQTVELQASSLVLINSYFETHFQAHRGGSKHTHHTPGSRTLYLNSPEINDIIFIFF